jgi:hypothetical protein
LSKSQISLFSIPAKELERKVKKEKNCSGVIKNEKNNLNIHAIVTLIS